MWQRLLFITSILLGLSSVLIGAMLDHSLSDKMTADQLNSMAIGLRYHQQYSILCIGIALILQFMPFKNGRRRLTASLSLFVVSTILFSGSIYAINVYSFSHAGLLTPLGGIGLIGAWASLLLLCSALKRD